MQPQWRRLAAVLDREMLAGHLRKSDPMLATWHFGGLVEAHLVERCLHGETTITAHEIKTAGEAEVSAFLKAYSSAKGKAHKKICKRCADPTLLK